MTGAQWLALALLAFGSWFAFAIAVAAAWVLLRHRGWKGIR